MATSNTKRTPAKATPAKAADDPVQVSADETAGAAPELLQFLDPDAAAQRKAEADAAENASDDDNPSDEAETEDAEDAPVGDAAPAESEEPRKASTPAGRFYIVQATALVSPEGSMLSHGSRVKLTEDKAAWLLERGMVKPA